MPPLRFFLWLHQAIGDLVPQSSRESDSSIYRDRTRLLDEILNSIYNLMASGKLPWCLRPWEGLL